METLGTIFNILFFFVIAPGIFFWLPWKAIKLIEYDHEVLAKILKVPVFLFLGPVSGLIALVIYFIDKARWSSGSFTLRKPKVAVKNKKVQQVCGICSRTFTATPLEMEDMGFAGVRTRLKCPYCSQEMNYYD